jgi:hypothetical protein
MAVEFFVCRSSFSSPPLHDERRSHDFYCTYAHIINNKLIMTSPRRHHQQHISLGPLTDDEEAEEEISYDRRRKYSLKRVKRVSRSAALATKQQLWDSNEISIGAALSAVDQWEAAYNAMRLLVVASVTSIKGVYGAAKDGAAQLEHGLLIPVRDWLILPGFMGLERAATETQAFLASQHAKRLAAEGLDFIKTVPYVGENAIAPALCLAVGVVQRTWEIAQYPIPSKRQVRESVDYALTGLKWSLSTAGREIFLYIKRADANITRTLSHTQWHVLGSGPYATLDKLSKSEVIDHLCDRYFRLTDPVARYELAAHIRAHNRPLYHDLVLTGVLKERGSELTKDDEWLDMLPVYRDLEEAFLIRHPGADRRLPEDVGALWYRHPNINGARPGKDTPWICFRRKEQKALEKRYHIVLRDGQGPQKAPHSATGEAVEYEAFKESRHPTIARWYSPNPEADVLVDQTRQAVSFFLCCPKCREPHVEVIPPLVQKQQGDLCNVCLELTEEMPSVATLLTPPPLSMVMRPTYWRFYGPGDSVRRATWFLDTNRNGLQPFDEEATAILEDAYLFLKWMSTRNAFDKDSELDGVLLTVEVPCPDGSDRLVQFSSLYRATAIVKGLVSSVALFKQRVYRGAWLKDKSLEETRQQQTATVEESVMKAVKDNGCLGDTLVPNMSIRQALSPPLLVAEDRLVMYEDAAASLAADFVLLDEKMGTYLDDHTKDKIDHLVLIIHGIGEMLRSIDVFGLSLPNLSSIIDCCAFLRKNHVEVQDAHFAQMFPGASVSSLSSTGRVEYLPVEWHEAFSILSQRSKLSDELQNCSLDAKAPSVMLKDISLRTIPNMRDFANDTLMDVLYFMSPEHHNIIVDVVTHEMNLVVDRFRRLSGSSGRVSVVGHSLGSIIVWDILANQVSPTQAMAGVSSEASLESNSSHYSTTTSPMNSETSPPEVTYSSAYASLTAYPQLNFEVDNFFMLGSPVAVFLMIRNQRKPVSVDFYLPGCSRVFNIFHPYDPVAYRLEPCIDPRNADFEPTIMKHWNGGFRVQYQTKRLWRQLIDTTWKTQQTFVEAFEARMATMGLIDSAIDEQADDETSHSEMSTDEQSVRVTTGHLNQGRRIDYMIQEKEIENANEYVAALAAHSSYWIEKDLSLFFARQIYLSTIEREAASERWEPVSAHDYNDADQG